MFVVICSQDKRLGNTQGPPRLEGGGVSACVAGNISQSFPATECCLDGEFSLPLKTSFPDENVSGWNLGFYECKHLFSWALSHFTNLAIPYDQR